MDLINILIIVAILILSPLSYIQAFLIIELRKKLGFLKFLLIFLGYICLWIADVYLLTLSYISLLPFVLIPVFVQIFGIFLLRKKFMIEIKRDILKWKH